MQAGERMIGTNGKECFLFPLENMWLTQGSYTATATHNGCYAMDFDGYLNGSFQTDMPMDTITSFIRYQLDKMPNWNIESIAVTGYNSYNYIYGNNFVFIHTLFLKMMMKWRH